MSLRRDLVHPHVTVHPSRADHLLLCRIPENIVSLGVHKLLFRVVVRARVPSVLPYRATRAWLDAREHLEARIVADEIDGRLAPNDQLFEKRIAIASRCRRTWKRKRNGMRNDVAEWNHTDREMRRYGTGSRMFTGGPTRDKLIRRAG